MVTYTIRAITWGVAQLLGIREAEPVGHADLEHAHWDPVTRRWRRHEELAAGLDRAA